MKFCKECGEKLAEHLQFCSNCGTEVERIEREKQEVELKPKKSKKAIILVILCAAVIALLIGMYQFGAYRFSKEKQVRAFIQAIEQQDVKQFKSFLKVKGDGVIVKEKEIQSYLRYIKEHPSYYQELKAYLSGQMREESIGEKRERFPDVKVIEDGEKWFLYPTYKLQVQPYYVTVQTNTKDAVLYVNDKKVAKVIDAERKNKIGPYFPGVYRVKAVAKMDFVTLENKKEVALIGENKKNIAVELPLEGYYVTIESNEDEAAVYVNGKQYGHLEKGSYELGPVATDETVEVYLEKNMDGETVLTDRVKIGEEDHYYLEFPEHKPNPAPTPAPETSVTSAEIEAFLSMHMYNSVRAINSRDFSIVEGEYDLSGKGYKTGRDYIAYLNKKGITEELLVFEVRNIERLNSSQYKVYSYEEYYIHYGDGSTKFKSFNSSHIVTVTNERNILYHSLASNETIQDKVVSGLSN